jgi:hypothetical protein
MNGTHLTGLKALVFDVFGTVVDWRSSIIRELEAFGRTKGIAADWTRIADEWRGGYHPAMDRVRKGELPWTVLDDLHRMTFDTLLAHHGVAGLSEAEKDHLVLAPSRTLAGCGRGADPPQAALHHRHALERQRGAAPQHGKAFGAAVGQHFFRRAGAPLQARSRDLSVRSGAAAHRSLRGAASGDP